MRSQTAWVDITPVTLPRNLPVCLRSVAVAVPAVAGEDRREALRGRLLTGRLDPREVLGDPFDGRAGVDHDRAAALAGVLDPGAAVVLRPARRHQPPHHAGIRGGLDRALGALQLDRV